MDAENLKTLIRQELPHIVRTDPEIRDLVISLAQERFADKAETESRFDRIMARWDRELLEDRRKWEENQRKWDEQKELWRQNEQRWQDWLAENRRIREEDRRKWEENQRKWDESQRKWEENQAEIRQLNRRIDSGIGALGARWGLQSEAAFRNGLKAILEESFGVAVLNYQDFDEEGKVFGRPDQVELDVIIRNGHLILCEIKSSMSRSDVYSFARKVTFYEEKHGREADRRLVISPMVEPKARQVAAALAIEVYNYADDVQTEKEREDGCQGNDAGRGR